MSAARPLITLKFATSLDGRIALRSGESRWITGEASRRAAHELRAKHDAVLVGRRTAVLDDPELTVRLVEFAGRQPLRIVLDSRQEIPSGLKLVTHAGRHPTLVVTTTEPEARLVEAGVRVVQVGATDEGRVDINAAVSELAAAGVERLMVEGGGEVISAFLRANLYDAVEWFRAPMILGGDTRAAVGALALDVLGDAPRLRRIAVETLGDDLWERYEAS
jgi:diaminohydroxyphosphoribosylaminopyrimidine deaminase/5-amino-6-(5-phosphoribosylamino)uracil reductase